MKRLTLLVLLATTATCYGQSGEEMLNSIGSSDMLADPVVAGASYKDEIEQWDRRTRGALTTH